MNSFSFSQAQFQGSNSNLYKWIKQAKAVIAEFLHWKTRNKKWKQKQAKMHLKFQYHSRKWGCQMQQQSKWSSLMLLFCCWSSAHFSLLSTETPIAISATSIFLSLCELPINTWYTRERVRLIRQPHTIKSICEVEFNIATW